jgi:hypothetical protein
VSTSSFKKHAMDISKKLASKSALAKHSHNTSHHICIENAKLVAREEHYIKRKTREALEIEQTTLNMDDELHR